ncbi:MAG: hypothetical protein HOK81_05735, partial [Rhodospirillaceae bacterium]|nr:hypothetical protein [Rhodospirillaceae bacterium]
MLRQALEIYRINSESVCFLDFGGKDFDEQQNISPVTPNKSFWRSALEVALDDLSTLVSPSQVVICEGVPHHPSASNNSAIDARCFDIIFSNEFPDCQFLSAGNASDVQSDRIGLLSSIQSIIEGVRITRLIDRDDRSQDEIEELKRSGVRVLSRRHLESYLFDEEVLRDLCISTGNSDCIATVLQARFDAIHASEQRGNSPDDIKSASGQIYVETKRILNLTQCGNSTKTFMRDTLSKHVSPASQIYRQLKEDIFGA